MTATRSLRGLERYAHRHPQLRASATMPSLLAAALQDAPPGMALDVGCGEGGTLRALERPHGRWAAGIELSVTRARITREEHCAVAVGDGLALPVADGAAAVVVSRHVIEHVADDIAALCEVRRVLHTGGRLYLETPLRLRGAWYPYRNDAGRWVLDPTHVREYTSVESVCTLLEAAGLLPLAVEVAPIRYAVRHVLHRLLRPSRRAATRLDGWLTSGRLALRVPRYREIRVLALRAEE